MTPTTILHGSSVSVNGQGVIITGASGSGKSTLALDMISRGAVLISDDRTVITDVSGCLVASAPENITGMIEAWGIGILKTQVAGPCPVRVIVDLDKMENHRLPQVHHIVVLKQQVEVIFGLGRVTVAAALIALVKGGRIEK